MKINFFNSSKLEEILLQKNWNWMKLTDFGSSWVVHLVAPGESGQDVVTFESGHPGPGRRSAAGQQVQ